MILLKENYFIGASKENLEYCIDLLEAKYDPQEFHKNVLLVIGSNLKTSDSRYLAIELFQEKVNKWKEKYNEKPIYDNETMLNYFVECVTYLYFDLYEYDKGINYFKKQYIEKNKEIKEYLLFNILDEYELYEEWTKEYEKNVGKIAYRNELKEKYMELKKITQV